MSLDIYSAIGNQVRVRLILCLSSKPKNVSEMITTCGLSQSSVSQHLSKLKKSGIVETKKVGKEVFYSIKNRKVIDVGRLLLFLEKEVV